MLQNINELIGVFNVSPILFIVLLTSISIRSGIIELTHDPEKLISRYEKLVRIERRTNGAIPIMAFENRRKPRTTLFPFYTTQRAYTIGLTIFVLFAVLISPLKK
jgi:hypothetical protein